MAKTRELKRRMKAVGNIERITKTMQMIATARFQASQKRATAAQPYTRKIAELVGELSAAAAASGGALRHPLLDKPERSPNRELLLVITSTRGLCGGYNASVLRAADRYLKSKAGKEVRLEVVGKKGVGYFRFQGRAIDKTHLHFGDKPMYEDIERLAQAYMDAYVDGQYDAINICYMTFQSMSRQTPKVLQLLPLEDPTETAEGAAGAAPRASAASADYEFSPDPATLLAQLLPVTVKTQLFQCFNEAVVSEQIARMVAMKAATDNAKQMGRDLSRLFNRARQTAITTELSEIIGGAAALE